MQIVQIFNLEGIVFSLKYSEVSLYNLSSY